MNNSAVQLHHLNPCEMATLSRTIVLGFPKPRSVCSYVVDDVFSCNQAALWMVQSIRPSVRPSVTPFWLCSHHHIIMKFSWVVTSDKKWRPCKRSRSEVKVIELNSQLSRFRTVTLVWIQISWGNDVQSSRSHSSKNRQIWPKLGVSEL